MFVKICGIRSMEELDFVERYADATGVVVECKSKRRIELEKAKEIIECSKIPVFVVSTLRSYEDWVRVIDKVNANYVQIHAEVNADLVEKIKDLGVYVMKAFKVPKKSENPKNEAEVLIGKIKCFKVDKVLLDTGCGSGETHDLEVSKIISSKIPIILAGGLNPENVSKIVKEVRPEGVDVSSGVEKGNRKDEYLVKKFVETVRGMVL